MKNIYSNKVRLQPYELVDVDSATQYFPIFQGILADYVGRLPGLPEDE